MHQTFVLRSLEEQANRAAAEDQARVLPEERVSELFRGLDFARVDDRAGNLAALIQEVWRLFLVTMLVALVVEAGLCLPKLARVAGAATAMLLARAGLRVLCVDRSRHGSDTLSTHALMRGGVLQLTKWGLLDAVVAAGTPPVRRTVFHYGEERFAVSIKPAAGTDALYAPRRTVLDALLVDEAVRSGVIVDFGTPVVGLCRAADDRVTGVLLQERRTGRVRAEYAATVVGADGRESLVAREVSATNEFAGQHAGSYLYGYWRDLPSDGYEWFYRPGLAAGMKSR